MGGYGLYLVVRALRSEKPGNLDHPLAILGLPLPLSLDNLLSGASLGALGYSAGSVAIVAGCATAIMSMTGMALGRLAANTVRIRTDLFGGVVLLVLAGVLAVRA